MYEKLTEEDPMESSVLEYIFQFIKSMVSRIGCQKYGRYQTKTEAMYNYKTVKRQFKPGVLILVVA